MAERISKRKKNGEAVAIEQLIKTNQWNPFERVDPKILEHMHRKLTNKKRVLDEYEESPI